MRVFRIIICLYENPKNVVGNLLFSCISQQWKEYIRTLTNIKNSARVTFATSCLH